jgi:hypothetical protein
VDSRYGYLASIVGRHVSGPNHLALILTAFEMELTINSSPMECKTCDALLVDYKRTVCVYKNAVRNIPGTQEDSTLAIAEAERLKQQCREASEVLMEHWRQQHAGLAAKPDS